MKRRAFLGSIIAATSTAIARAPDVSGVRYFKMDDSETYAAESKESAIAAITADTGIAPEEIVELPGHSEVWTGESPDDPEGTTSTFAIETAEHLRFGGKLPFLVASTEW